MTEEEKKVEQLLKPRYIVVADYPNAEMPVGLVVTNLYGATWGDGKEYQFNESELWFKRFPHLFRKLNWWEHMEESEMPQYVRLKDMLVKIDDVNGFKTAGEFIKYYAEECKWAILPVTEQNFLTHIK